MELTRKDLDAIKIRVHSVKAGEVKEGATVFVRDLDSNGIDAIQDVAKQKEGNTIGDLLLVDRMVQIFLCDGDGKPLYPLSKTKTVPNGIKNLPLALKQRIIYEAMDFIGMSEESQTRMQRELKARPLVPRGSSSRGNGVLVSRKRNGKRARRS